MSKKTVPDNVVKFLHKASRLYGAYKEKEFCGEMFSQCSEAVTDSPIEQLFFVAIHAMAESVFCPLNQEAIFHPFADPVLRNGVYMSQQQQIGKYRVDFSLKQIGVGPDDIYRPIVIELDGHDFHDRDKAQRSYEKARDRYLVKQGYRVLHYTGSDIVADPFKAAFEALEMIGAMIGCCGPDDYNAKDPLGLIYR